MSSSSHFLDNLKLIYSLGNIQRWSNKMGPIPISCIRLSIRIWNWTKPYSINVKSWWSFMFRKIKSGWKSRRIKLCFQRAPEQKQRRFESCYPGESSAKSSTVRLSPDGPELVRGGRNKRIFSTGKQQEQLKSSWSVRRFGRPLLGTRKITTPHWLMLFNIPFLI